MDANPYLKTEIPETKVPSDIEKANQEALKPYLPIHGPKQTPLPTKKTAAQENQEFIKVLHEVTPSTQDGVGVYENWKQEVQAFPALETFIIVLTVLMIVFAVPLWRKLNKKDG